MHTTPLTLLERLRHAHYQLGKLLGAGGMGMFYEALDTHLLGLF